MDEKEIDNKIRTALLNDIQATVEEDGNIDMDAVESYAGYIRWVETAPLEEIIDEYGIEDLEIRACLDEDEVEYLKKKYGG